MITRAVSLLLDTKPLFKAGLGALMLAATLCLPACSMLGLRGVSVEEASRQPYRLRVGDEVEVSVGGRTDSAVKISIQEDGMLLYAAAGNIPAAGRSIREVEMEIEKLLHSQSAEEPTPGQPAVVSEFEAITPAQALNQVYRLQVGDSVGISVWEHSELTLKAQVRSDGTFPYPLLGSVQATGRTTAELEEELRKQLDQNFLVNPQVTVHLGEAQFTVLGQKGESGTFPMEGTTDLMTAISKAGDLLTLRTSRVEIIRRQGNKQVVIRTNVDRLLNGQEPNIPVLPRDTLYVKAAAGSDLKVSLRLLNAKFTALGEVNNPGTYSIEGSMDVLTAVSIAGGISKFGSSHLEIIRTLGDQKVVIRANIDRILKGRGANFPILPRDTLYARRRLL